MLIQNILKRFFTCEPRQLHLSKQLGELLKLVKKKEKKSTNKLILYKLPTNLSLYSMFKLVLPTEKNDSLCQISNFDIHFYKRKCLLPSCKIDFDYITSHLLNYANLIYYFLYFFFKIK